MTADHLFVKYLEVTTEPSPFPSEARRVGPLRQR